MLLDLLALRSRYSQALKRNVFIAAVFCCGTVVLGQVDNDIVRWDLKGSPLNDDGPPDTLPIYVEIATVQPDVERGIVFTLNIENNNAQAIRILDPIDTMGIGLTGFTRPFTRSLRNTRSDSSICFIGSFSPEQLKTMHDDKMAKRPFQVFDIEEARHNPRLKTVSDIVPWEPPPHLPRKAHVSPKTLSDSERFNAKVGGKLTLEPGQRFTAVLQITSVYANHKAYKEAYDEWISDYIIPNSHGSGTTAAGAPPRPEPEIIPIPADKYHFSVSILLFTNNGGQYIASSYAVPSNKLIIQLGPPSSPKQQNAGNTP